MERNLINWKNSKEEFEKNANIKRMTNRMYKEHRRRLLLDRPTFSVDSKSGFEYTFTSTSSLNSALEAFREYQETCVF